MGQPPRLSPLTQCATLRLSLTIGPRTMHARISVTVARGNARAGRNSEPNSSFDGRRGSTENPHPTARTTHGLRGRVSPCGYILKDAVAGAGSGRAGVADEDAALRPPCRGLLLLGLGYPICSGLLVCGGDFPAGSLFPFWIRSGVRPKGFWQPLASSCVFSLGHEQWGQWYATTPRKHEPKK
jgi:hypothetical protein